MLSKIIMYAMSFGACALAWGCSFDTLGPLSKTSTNALLSRTEGAPQRTPDQILVIGDISSNPAKKIEQYQPLATYLENHLADVGIEQAVVKIAPDIESMQALIAEGEIDLYFDSPYPAMRVSRSTGAEPILRRWKQGIGQYHSVIFALKDRGIQSVEDLRNKRVALESDFSTSGYMLPFAYLHEAGFNLVEQPLEKTVLQLNDISFLFSENEENTIELVLSGKVDAGAIDSGTFAELPEHVRSSIHIILETESVARHIVVASAQLPVHQRDAIKALLLQMHVSVDGQVVLESFENTAKFDEFPVDLSIERLEELYNQTL